MDLYLDTASIKEIEEIASWGILDGVTTNPTLMSKEKGDYRKILRRICDIVQGPVSAEVIATDHEGMVVEAKDLAKISEHIVIKIPCTVEGIRATRRLSTDGIRVNMTLVFSLNQALLAAKAGASYISPFVGRLDDRGEEGLRLIEDIVTLIHNYDFPTRIIFASVRHPYHVREAALIGADIATIPYKVFKLLITHPLTDLGLERFLSDWKKR
ncbi:fructose-6-phosphate aldolase [candidate division WOR-3 bacterium]|uniref:Probable transaldolase n=1 Tax=candidate division WOR-3 bacterium TaxID=2052148 RepID=A0A660SMK3_UNCW3|nr:MAG: fructose-6-phosphate aldolase [candidate division WOR-3 bacterium]